MVDEEVYLFARKPCSLEEVKENITEEISPKELRKMAGTQKVFTDSFECWDDFYNANLSGCQWWRIVLQQERVEVLVDTQGYDYPRYVGILDENATKFTTFKYDSQKIKDNNSNGSNIVAEQCEISISNNTKKELDELLKSAQRTGIANDLDGVISFIISKGGSEAVYEVESDIKTSAYL